jgi:hypothetical protein
MARFIPDSEHVNSLTWLYDNMEVGDEARVLRSREMSYVLLKSVWYRRGRQEKMARGEDVPWLYLEPAVARVNGEVIEATMVVRVADEVECWGLRKKFLKEGVT